MIASNKPVSIRLKDYKRSEFCVKSIDIEIELRDDKAIVNTRIIGNRNPSHEGGHGPLILNGENQELISVALNDKELTLKQYAVDDKSLKISNVCEDFELKIINIIYPHKNEELEGLYRSDGMYCTQCEAEGFRKITFFLDRPDIMATYKTKIIADKENYPLLLSNGHLVESGDLDKGQHFAVWEDPFPKPSYLFAMVAGDLGCLEDSFITMSGKEVILKIFVEHGEELRASHAMSSLKKAMLWDEEEFGLEYDLKLFMIVAVSHFNMGAMENKGLNIFNSRYVLADNDSATDMDFQRIESIIAHEYFHNWTGNRVTCRDWFQLSLKEGLTVFRDQEFSAAMHSRGVQRINAVRTLRSLQFPEDFGPMSHAVRPECYIEINNFYTVTVYEKGAEVVRLIHSFVGQERFRKGLDLYFQRHDGEAVTCEDFLSAMQAVSDKDLSPLMFWYTQSGTPELIVSSSYDAQKQEATMTVKQLNLPTADQGIKKPLLILLEMGLLDKNGNEYPVKVKGNETSYNDSKFLEIFEKEQTFVFEEISFEPVPALLRGFSSPVKLKVDLSFDDLSILMTHEKDPFVRWNAAQEYSERLILEIVENKQCGSKINLDKDYVRAIKEILLNENLEPALRAELLRIPSENDLSQKMEIIDVEGIHAARRYLISSLGVELHDSFNDIFHKITASVMHCDLSTNAMGSRALIATSLGYLSASGSLDSLKLCLNEVVSAKSMTLTMAGLNALNDVDCYEREEALMLFYKRWHDKPLELDKWFSLNASSTLSTTIEKVNQLTSHKSYNLGNPNRIRALVGTFVSSNPVNFHRADGAGYKILTDTVISLNSINPQIGARLVAPLTEWKGHNGTRQKLMLNQLNRIIEHADLSKDIFEIVSKGLMQH